VPADSPPSLVSCAGGCWPVIADGDGWGIADAGPQGPGGRVVDERDIGSLQPVDQVRGLSRRRDLGAGLFPALAGMAAVRVQDGQSGQPGQDLVLAHDRFFGRPGLEPAALV
jgi:hypothetical protein